MEKESQQVCDRLEQQLKDCEEDLEKERSFLDQVQRIARLGSWHWDRTTGEIYWSHELFRILGLSPRKLRPSYEAFADTVHPDDREVVEKSFAATIRGEKSLSITHRIVWPDGEVRFVQQRAAITLREEGRPVRIVGFVQDITELRKTEDLLRKAHAELARRFRELRAINKLGRLSTGVGAVEQVVSRAEEQIKAILQPDLVIIYSLEKRDLIVQGRAPCFEEFPHVHKVGECLCGLAAEEGRPQHSVDIHSDPRCTLEECKEAGLRSFCAVPLIEGDATVGVLAVGSYSKRDFSRHLLFLEAFAGQLAAVLSNAKLFRELERAREDLERRVEERTRELSGANERLKRKIREVALTETALRESEARFRELAELLPQIVYEVDLNGNFTFLNRAALKELGYSSEELSWGLDSRKVFIPKAPKTTMENISNTLRGKTFKEEYIVRRKDGSTFRALAYSSPIFRDGGMVGLRGVAIDVTEQRIAEERQAELIEEIKHFAYVVSHDLHAPLVNIKGFCDELGAGLDMVRPALQKLLPHLEDEEERLKVAFAMEQDIPESLHFINSSVVRMSRLIGEVLELSRAGRRHLQYELLDMNEIVDNVLKSLEHQIRKAGVRVDVHDLPKTLADRISMEQIVANLIDNAIKYLDQEKSPVIEITGFHFPDQNVFVVRDTGRGIKPADQSRIFHVFQRSGEDAAPGMGMGLAHTKTLIERHGGRIWCESEPGLGSTFTFTISNRLVRDDIPR